MFKNKISSVKSGVIRQSLVVLQFVVSIFFIIFIFVSAKQLHFMKTKDLGFDKDQLIVVTMDHFGENTEQIYERFKNAISKYPQIKNLSGSHSAPDGSGGAYNFVGYKGKDIFFFSNRIDYDYLKTMGIKLVQGRDFLRDFRTDKENAAIVNESFLKKLNLDQEILGKTVLGYKIIGIMQDYHVKSLHQKISPVLFYLKPSMEYRRVNIKLAAGKIPETLKLIKNTWREIFPNYPFMYFFLDDQINKNYQRDEQLQQISITAAFLTILLACLGIFALTTLNISKRTKEIGIRKVCGASVQNILTIVSKNLLIIVTISFLIAVPVSWFVMNKWLQNFVYRIDLTVLPFLLAGLTTLVIALLTVSWQAIRAATANPVDSLRYE